MYTRYVSTLALIAAASGVLAAQPRKASFVGGGGPDRGKCTIEVRVDGSAEVEIRGDTANMRNLAGQPPQWRRFECTSPLPPNVTDFQFAGVDGRGRQQLVRDPRNGGAAVIRIDDPDNGSEGYTFDITWRTGNASQAPPPPGPDPRSYRDQPSGRDQRSDRDQRPGGGDSFYRDRDEWFHGERWQGRLFERVKQDVEHVQSVTFPVGGDQYRLVRTRQQLDELQGKLARGRYDEQELDDVIRAMGQVLRDNRLSGRDRDLLSDDLSRLRDFRARHDEYGARGGR